MITDHTIEHLFHSLISGDSRQARGLIEGVLAEGASLDELIVEAYRPIAAMIESLCRSRQLSDRARDHATMLLQNLVDDAKAGHLPRAGTEFDPDRERACEIETIVRRRDAEVCDDGARLRRRAIATHRRGSEVKTPFTTMSFRDGVLRVRLVGPQVNQRESQIMREEIERALDLVGPGLHAFILDLSEIESMASFALGMCIELRNRAAGFGARSLMTGANRRLDDLLSLLNVDRMYERAEVEAVMAA